MAYACRVDLSNWALAPRLLHFDVEGATLFGSSVVIVTRSSSGRLGRRSTEAWCTLKRCKDIGAWGLRTPGKPWQLAHFHFSSPSSLNLLRPFQHFCPGYTSKLSP